MRAYSVLLCILHIFVLAKANKDLLPGKYKIYNVQDNLYLTVQGANASYAVVVSDTWQNFAEQRWQAIKLSGAAGLHLIPEKYKFNNVLSYNKEATKKYPLPETWKIYEVAPQNSGIFLVKNERTSYCLTSKGRRRNVVEESCYVYRKDQQWKFMDL